MQCNHIGMSTDEIKLDGTIFDYEAWGKHFNSPDKEIKNSQFKVIYYALTIILQVINLIFLFDYRSTEYLVYVFSFIVFCVAPFLWIGDLRNFGNALSKGTYKNLFKYKEFSLLISFLLTFLGILLVILTNENVRKYKAGVDKNKEKMDFWDLPESERDEEENKYKSELNNLELKDNKRKYNDKVIRILYATIMTFHWGLVAEAFSQSSTFGKDTDTFKLNKYSSGFTRTIEWLLNQPYLLASNVDKKVHRYTDAVHTTPLMKSFSLYCVTFITMFFGLFIRIPKTIDGDRYTEIKNPAERFDAIRIINMPSLFTPVFYRQIHQYKETCLFFLSMFLIIIAFFLIRFVNNMTGGRMGKMGTTMSFAVSIALIFGLTYGLQHTMNEQAVESVVGVLLSMIFAFLGTPVLMGLMQLFMEGGFIGSLIGLFGNFFIKVANNIRKFFNLGDPWSFFPISRTLNMFDSSFILKMSIGVFVALFLVMLFVGLGITGLLDNSYVQDVKSMKLINAILVTMAVSLFVSLTPSFNMFTNLYKTIKMILETLMVYIIPIGSVIIALVLFIFAYQNHHKNIVHTDG